MFYVSNKDFRKLFGIAGVQHKALNNLLLFQDGTLDDLYPDGEDEAAAEHLETEVKPELYVGHEDDEDEDPNDETFVPKTEDEEDLKPRKRGRPPKGSAPRPRDKGPKVGVV